ncbi:hypothetical protein HGQ17_04720 [Nesterenkonia sp. MY13]|uniref:Uncharacterized protein n=1 Tax=Nesterenkonia sedimenti TaxID=1463632 RepID=A0A7X8TIP4_9MICC|nr:hypothetical protein [Nesterenkonia sedimenti]NLS09319.1 hypothetical protein [Nesterenkonia sedimenti]
MEQQTTKTTAGRNFARRAATATAAGFTALGLTLGAAVPAQASADFDEEAFDALLKQLITELESEGLFDDDFVEQIGLIGDEETDPIGEGISGDEDPFEGDSDEQGILDEDEEDDDEDSDRDGENSWTYDEPLTGSELAEILIGADDLPEGWSSGESILHEQAGDAFDAEDIELVEDSVVVIGPEGDGDINKSFYLDGFDVSDSCAQAVEDFDSIEEETEYAALTAFQGESADIILAVASTEEEMDLFGANYTNITDECGTTVTEGPMTVDIDLFEVGEGFTLTFSGLGEGGNVSMGGGSYGNNHVFLIGEGEIDDEDLEHILGEQLDKMDQAVN